MFGYVLDRLFGLEHAPIWSTFHKVPKPIPTETLTYLGIVHNFCSRLKSFNNDREVRESYI